MLILNVSQNEGRGCIIGNAWFNDAIMPNIGASIIDTDISVVADSNGTYVFDNLEPGFYSIKVYDVRSEMLFCKERDNIEVVPGDTTYADIFSRILRDNPNDNIPYVYRSILLQIDNPEGHSLDGFLAYNGYNRIPTERIDSNLYSIGIVGQFSGFKWSLPWMGEQQVTIRDCPATRRYPVNILAKTSTSTPWAEALPLYSNTNMDEYPLALADSIYDEWCIDNYDLSHTTIDPRREGCSTDSKYIKSSVVLNNDNSWELISVFQDEIVLINSDSSVRRMKIDPEVAGCSISPSGKHVIVCNIVRGIRTWFLVNTESREITQIDPFPELTLEEEGGYFGEATIAITPRRDLRICDDGSILGVYDREIRTYAPNGEQNQFINFRDFGNFERGWIKIDYSDNNENWILLYAYDEKILIQGNNDSVEVIDTEDMDLDGYTGVIISSSGRFLAFTGRAGGLTLYDTENGKSIILERLNTVSSLLFSLDDSKFAYLVDDSQGNMTCKIYSIANEISLHNSFPSYSLRYVAAPKHLTNEGWLMMTLGGRRVNGNTGSRSAIVNSEGKMVWLGHHETSLARGASRINTMNTSSSDNFSGIISDGYLVHFLEFTEVD